MSTLQIGNNVIIKGSQSGPAGNKIYGSITGIYSAEGIIPTGAIIYTATIDTGGSHVIPSGYLPCNGLVVSKFDYPELYYALGSPTGANSLWNQGAIGGFPGVGINYLTSNPINNPGTYFRIPYLNGVFIRCWSGPSDYTLDNPGGVGRVLGSFKTDIIPSATLATSGSVALMAIIKY